MTIQIVSRVKVADIIPNFDDTLIYQLQNNSPWTLKFTQGNNGNILIIYSKMALKFDPSKTDYGDWYVEPLNAKDIPTLDITIIS